MNAALPRHATPRRPLLLVEDNPVDLDLTLRALTSRRHSPPVEVARDGEEALAWLARWESGEPPPVMVLLDLKLPKVGGLEVLRQLKTHPRLRSTVVVVMSTSDEPSDVRQAYALGANSYVVKPLSYERFIEVAEQIDRYWLGISQPAP